MQQLSGQATPLQLGGMKLGLLGTPNTGLQMTQPSQLNLTQPTTGQQQTGLTAQGTGLTGLVGLSAATQQQQQRPTGITGLTSGLTGLQQQGQQQQSTGLTGLQQQRQQQQSGLTGLTGLQQQRQQQQSGLTGLTGLQQQRLTGLTRLQQQGQQQQSAGLTGLTGLQQQGQQQRPAGMTGLTGLQQQRLTDLTGLQQQSQQQQSGRLTGLQQQQGQQQQSTGLTGLTGLQQQRPTGLTGLQQQGQQSGLTGLQQQRPTGLSAGLPTSTQQQAGLTTKPATQQTGLTGLTDLSSMAKSCSESCAPLPVTGYENEFVDSIPDTLCCPVCLLPSRDPHLVSCCGAKFCEPCIGRVKAASQPCPLCKQEFNTMLDRGDQCKVLNLKVRCSRHKDGCQWVRELRHVLHHEREECEWAVVRCSYQCGARLSRRLMAKHEHEECPQRPMDVKLEHFMKKMEQRHQREMAELKKEMKEIESKMVEQEKEMITVRDALQKMKDEYTIKMSTMEETLINVTTVNNVEEVIPLLRGILIISNHVPIELNMTEYSIHKNKNDQWYSSPFYTGPGGYKMCINVSANGTGDGAGTRVSVYVHLMRGEYDRWLVWPFRGDVTIQLVNHNNDQDHREMTVHFKDAAVAHGERGEVWAGYTQFISHADVESSTETRRYIINDCLTFRVTKIVVDSV